MNTETIQELISAHNLFRTLAELARDGAETLAEILDTVAGENPTWQAQRRQPLEPLPDIPILTRKKAKTSSTRAKRA